MARSSTAETTSEPVLSPDQAATLGTELETASRAVVGKLANVKIATDVDLEQAVLDRQDLGDRAKRVQEFFKPFKEMAYKLHRTLCDRENEILGPILKLDGQIKSAMSVYIAEQDRLRRLEEERIAEERRQAEQTRLAAEAAVLERQGDTELAEAVMEQAIAAPMPFVSLPSLRKTVQGLKTRREWKWRPVGGDTPAARQRAMQLVPREYLTLDDQKIGAYAKAMKESGKIPGIDIYYEDVPVR